MDTPDQKQMEYIERYLNNELPDQERITFDAEVQSNDALREQVDWVRNLPKALFSMEKERLSEQVKNWMDDKSPADQYPIQNAKPEPNNSFFRVLRIASSVAAVFLVVFLAWFFLGSNKTLVQQTNEHIALHHTDPVILRGNQKEEWKHAIQLYKERDFDNMIGTMQALVNDPNASLEQLFYLGLAHLYTTPPALDSTLYYFSLTTQKDALTYKEDIDWYTSLVYIKQGEMEKARALLDAIQVGSSKYKEQASSLIQQLSE